MKRFSFVIAALFIAVSVNAQNNDTLRVETLNEVVVSGVRVQKNAPFAVTNIKKAELNDFSKTGQELPFLFAKTPGIIAWSENGVGTGTSYMRIRGAGDSRINVTLDGVSLNSPEDQCVFWANMNSYGSLLSSVQIQRGVGTSTNGDGAFGGTIALSSATPSSVPSAEITGSYGSFNTLNFGAKASTGLLWNHLIIDGAYHQTNTDGFIHGTQGCSGSYYGGLVANNTGTINKCYAKGVVSGSSSTNYVGGLVGTSSGTVTSSYAKGTIKGSSYVGGLIGYNSKTVTNSYAVGAITGSSYVGGLVGYNYSTSSNVDNKSYFDKTTTGKTAACGTNAGTCSGVGYTTTQMKVAKTEDNLYKDWSDDIWTCSADNYPQLKNVP